MLRGTDVRGPCEGPQLSSQAGFHNLDNYSFRFRFVDIIVRQRRVENQPNLVLVCDRSIGIRVVARELECIPVNFCY
jgi:hypothetical protein